MPIPRVLVTGMSGLIGQALRAQLQGSHELTALNRRDVEGARTIQADIADLDAISPAFAGQEIVVHLAGYRGYDWPSLLNANIVGTYNVFEAARLAGVRRVIFASSGATVSGWQRDEPLKSIVEGRYADAPADWQRLTHETPIRPAGIYGCTKVWGEALARDFSEAFDISILCLRFGAVTAEDRPTSPAMIPAWCSQRDAVQMIERSIAAPASMKFEIFHAISKSRWGVRDASRAQALLGYAPLDCADDFEIA